MSARDDRVPLLLRLSVRLLPADVRDEVLGDLLELWRAEVRHRPWAQRVRWLFRQPLAVAISWSRFGGRRRGIGLLSAGSLGAGISWLDVKLGVRMVVKYPGLSLVGGLGMAVAIAIGAGFFEATAGAIDSTLPFEGGERVVAIENWDTEINNQERRILHDFAVWRDELESVKDIGAWRWIERNMSGPDGSTQLVRLAAITASGFRLTQVPPLMGRTLVEADEQTGAPPVVVIGYEIWETRFAGDRDIVGQEVRIGGVPHTVVGVMPEGFAFPLNHDLWIPLHADAGEYKHRQGPSIFVFGRLAGGYTLEEAQAQLNVIEERLAAAYPQSHEHLRPHIVPYTMQLFDDMEGWEVPLFWFLVSSLLVVVCVNVAALVYARTTTRLGEFAVRNALGASRRRIVGQLFMEALVLSVMAAAVGLVVAELALEQLDAVIRQLPFAPFWMEFDLSAGTAVYVAGLAVLAAVLVGVVPAVKATGRQVQSGLRELGGNTGLRLGRTWTALIVLQVAFTVALLPAAVLTAGDLVRVGFADPGIATGGFLTTRLDMDEIPPTAEAEASDAEFAVRYRDRLAELVRRLEAEPAVSDVILTTALPGTEPTARIELDGGRPPGSVSHHSVRSGRVGFDFFDGFGVPVLAGRRFGSGDLGTSANAVIVNRPFVDHVLGGGNALGRRIRYVAGYREGGRMRMPAGVELNRWYEIIGVVADFPPTGMKSGTAEARLYHPLAPARTYPARLVLRVRNTDAAAFAGRFREITTALDPTLKLEEMLTLEEALRGGQTAMRLGGLGITVATLSVLLLSAAGIHALMSFAVARRRREIGIRAALGANPRRLLASIFSRALGQLAIGVGIGVLVAALLPMGNTPMLWEGVVLLLSISAFMIVVGVLAAIGPARRGLRIQPTEALRAEEL